MKGGASTFFQNPSFHGALIALPVALCSEALLVGLMPDATPLGTLGRVITLTMVLFVLHRFAQMSLSRFEPRFVDMVFLLVSYLGTLGLMWSFRILALSVSSYPVVSRLESIRPDTLMYLTPFAAAPLVLQAVLGMHYGLVFAIGLAAITRLYFPTDAALPAYVLVATLIACISLSRFRSRAAYLKAGLNVALIGVAFAFASVLLVPAPEVGDVAVRALSAIIGAALAAFLASGITPIVEYLWGYVTDMRLLEIATLDHPLLKELSLRAPGTWNHSMVMGMMAESAADAIEANPVVARVGAYFHDIGKMTKPLYFVENQFGEENRHDKLSPSMSALIIRSHVKEGIELARQHKLPRVIEEMIPQHHGTSVIEYFYDKASKEAEEAGTEVDKNLYRYPGPKPQTREAGILMLADGIEAAARTLSEPTLDRIRGMVQKLINKVFASGELDECELTLKDLHLIAKCFTRVLHSIHHQRIAYAEPAEKTVEKEEPEAGSAKELGGSGAGKKPKAEGEERGGKEGNKEDLKRLGL